MCDILTREVNNDEISGKIDNYSEFTVKLTQTIAFIYKGKYMQENTQTIIGKVLDSQIIKIIKLVKKYKKDL